MQFGYEQLEVWQRSVAFAVKNNNKKSLEQEALEIAAMLKGLINAIGKKSS